MRQYFLITTEKDREIKRAECTELHYDKDSDTGAVIKAFKAGYEKTSNFIISIKEGVALDKGVLHAARVYYNTTEEGKKRLSEKELKKAEKAETHADLRQEKVFFGYGSEYGQLNFMQEQHDMLKKQMEELTEMHKEMEQRVEELDGNRYDLNSVSGYGDYTKGFETLYDHIVEMEQMQAAMTDRYRTVQKEVLENLMNSLAESAAQNMLKEAQGSIQWR